MLPYLQFNELDKLNELLAVSGKARLQSAVAGRRGLPIIGERQQTAPLTTHMLATALDVTGSGSQG